jgi:uncharacterized protein
MFALMLTTALSLVILVALSAGLLSVAYAQTNTLVAPKRRLAPRSPESVGISIWEEVAFQTADGLTLRGWFVPPGRDGAVAVLAHGTAAHRGYLLPQAASLHRAGYGVLLFDLRAHGASEGRVSSFGIHEIHDIDASLNYLRTRSDVRHDRIALIGHSMGGAAALRSAARQPGVRALVVIAAVSSLEENLLHGVRHFSRAAAAFGVAPLILRLCEWRVGGRIADMRPIADVERLGTLPLLLIYGTQDALVPFTNGRRLQRARDHDTKLITVRRAGHRSILNQEFLSVYEAELLAFLDTNLRTTNAPTNNITPMPRVPTQTSALEA